MLGSLKSSEQTKIGLPGDALVLALNRCIHAVHESVGLINQLVVAGVRTRNARGQILALRKESFLTPSFSASYVWLNQPELRDSTA